MKVTISLLFSFILSYATGFSQSEIQLNEQKRKKIEDIIKKEYKNAESIEITSAYLDKFTTYMDDGAYNGGIKMVVNKDCIQISFQIKTYNNDNTIKFIDTHQFLIPKGYVHVFKNGKCCFYKNNFHGKGYHGGSGSIMNIEKWIQDTIDTL